jgi:Co/Zn/Cd efflux system component
VTDTRARRAPDPLTSGRERSRDRERRLRVAIALNVVIVVGQVVFGLVAGSLGLLSDAGHNLTDVSALVLSLIAIRIARRPPTSTRSFGWHRGTVLAAQANAAISWPSPSGSATRPSVGSSTRRRSRAASS